MSHLPVLIIIIPLSSAFLLAISNKLKPRVTLPMGFIFALLHGFVCLQLGVRLFLYGPQVYAVGNWLPPFGIMLIADQFSAVFIILTGLLHPLFLGFRLACDGSSGSYTKTVAVTSLYCAAMSGIAVAGDLFNLFVFIELAAVCSIGFIVHKRSPKSSVASFIYIMLMSVSGSLLLFAIILIYLGTGALSIPEIASSISLMPPRLHKAACICLTVSFAAKIGMVPMHFWQPRAYHAAGSSAAGLLSGLGTKLYLYALMRLLWLQMQAISLMPLLFTIILISGCINIITGHLMALIEKDLKRMLAFSSIAHTGYILTAFGAAGVLLIHSNPAARLALAAGLLHCVLHALMKPALLWSSHSMISAARNSTISGMHGSGRKAPLSMAAFILASSVIIGLPPGGGFVSKWYIAVSQPVFFPIIVIAAGTVASLYYYARFATIALGRKTLYRPPSKFLLPGLTAMVPALGAFLAGPVEAWLMPFLTAAADRLLDIEGYISLLQAGAGL